MRKLSLGIVALAGAMAVLLSGTTKATGVADTTSTASPLVKHLEYVVADGALYVYSIDDGNRLVRKVSLPQIDGATHGMVASAATRTLYISFGNQQPPGGSLLAYDLLGDRVLWKRSYAFGIDSMAISPDGARIYMPAGEATKDGAWRIIDARTGTPTGSEISAGAGAHNTIMGPDGHRVYLGGVDYPYLAMANTTTNEVVRRIGPLNGPGVRPFTINGSQTLAFTTARSFLGFQVSSIETGKVLYTVSVPGFSFDPETFRRTPNHGISLSPDETELYLIDTPNGYVHAFDVSGLPSHAPRDVADIKLAHPPPNDGWLLHSRDGRYVYVGRAGDLIDTATHTVVSFLPPLQRTADYLEIDWQYGVPVATTSRYGVGYVEHEETAPPGG
jgi:DNA-binding beta-propeller fold protein YncE